MSAILTFERGCPAGISAASAQDDQAPLIACEKQSVSTFGQGCHADWELARLVESRPNLKGLDLSGRCELTENALIEVVKILPDLQELRLAYWAHLTDEGLAAVVSSVPNLHTLDVAGCARLTVGGLAAAFKALPHLRTLNLENLRTLPIKEGYSAEAEEGFVTSIRALPNLHTLNLSCWLHVSDHTLAALVQGLVNLQTLDLSGCTLLSDNGLEAIKTLTNLHTLNLNGCDQLTERGVQEVVRSLPHIRTLHLDERCTQTIRNCILPWMPPLSVPHAGVKVQLFIRC